MDMNKKTWYWVLAIVIVVLGGWYYYSKTSVVGPSNLTAGYWKDTGLKDMYDLTGRKQACEAKLHSCFKDEAFMNKLAVENEVPGEYAGRTIPSGPTSMSKCGNMCNNAINGSVNLTVCNYQDCVYRCFGARILPEEDIAPGCNQIMVDTTTAI